MAVNAEAGKEKRIRAKNEAWAFYGEPEMAVWLKASAEKRAVRAAVMCLV